jgi:putative transposase
MSVWEKRPLISPNPAISIQRQCSLLGLERSSYYYAANESENDTELINEIKDIWIEWPFYGYRKITDELADRGTKQPSAIS